MVQCPVGGSGEGLRAVAVAGVFRGNAAALLEPAPEVGVIEHHLADEPALQADGKVDGAAGGEIGPGHIVEIGVGQGLIA